jgi:biopolymer transport protein ExbD
MAEINTGEGKKEGKKRSKKMSTKVDMTPMVDLAFLLITFFMLTTTFSKKFSMQITMPDKNKQNLTQKVKPSRAITVIVGENDKIYWFDDPIKKTLNPTDYSDQGIRKVLLDKQKVVDSLIVVIKPMSTSKYKNIVDLMDEINITNTPISAIVDITPQDELLVKDFEVNSKN